VAVVSVLSLSSTGRAQSPPIAGASEPSSSTPESTALPGGIYAQLRELGDGQGETPLGGLRLPTDLDAALAQALISPDFINVDHRRMTVKFREGSGVRLREGVLRVERTRTTLATLQRLLRTGITEAVVERDVAQVRDLVQSRSGSFERLAPRVGEAD